MTLGAIFILRSYKPDHKKIRWRNPVIGRSSTYRHKVHTEKDV